MIEEIMPDPQPLPLEEQMNQKLVKQNVTEAVIAALREKYLPLKIAGLDDKETYLIVKEGRKECKALRVIAKKICEDGREDAVAIQKAWVAKQKEVTGKIAEVEDYLEEQEKKYEADLAAEKDARKRKQEEQLITRMQKLNDMSALYADGSVILGEVEFELSAIKESEDDIWNETILPKYQAEYEKIEAERIEQDRIKSEKEAELKRQQEELEAERKRLKDEADRLYAEKKRQDEAKEKARIDELTALGLKPDFSDKCYKGYDVFVAFLDIQTYDDNKWAELIQNTGVYIEGKKTEEAEAKRKEQERIELNAKRKEELRPYEGYGYFVDKELSFFAEDEYQIILTNKREAWEKAQKEKEARIAEKAAKEERERIEEEQRQAEAKRIKDQREFRLAALSQYNVVYNGERGELGALSDELWWSYINDVKATYEEILRKQEEERKADELAKASDKEKWEQIIGDIVSLGVVIDSLPMRSGQYRKKAAILREKLEEIKAL